MDYPTKDPITAENADDRVKFRDAKLSGKVRISRDPVPPGTTVHTRFGLWTATEPCYVGRGAKGDVFVIPASVHASLGL